MDLLVDKEEGYVADVDGNMGLVNNDLSSSSKAHALLEDDERRRKDGEEFTVVDMKVVQEASEEF